jgi:hypothetical protein
MVRKRYLNVRMCLACLAAWGVLSMAIAGDTPKVELKLAKGDKFAYTVTNASSTESKSQRGEFKGSSASELKYAIAVEDKKDNGDIILKVTYAAVKIKEDGRDGAWEFDSAKAGTAGDENLVKAVKSAITVTIAGNKVKEVTGFPEVAPAPEGEKGKREGKRGPMGGRGFRGMNAVGRGALTRDLTYFLAPPVQGVALEKGKAYQIPRPAQTEPGSQPRERGMGFAMASLTGLDFTYEGTEKAGDADVAKFALARKPPETGAPGPGMGMMFGGGPAKGSALVCMKDGLLQKMELASESSRSGDREGQSFSFSGKSSTTIVRTPVK